MINEKTEIIEMSGPKVFDPPLDKGIETYVRLLHAYGIETYESCEGGEGHSYSEPTVRFHGNSSVGFMALHIALEHGFPVKGIGRVWDIIDGQPTGPNWEMVFWGKGDAVDSNDTYPV